PAVVTLQLGEEPVEKSRLDAEDAVEGILDVLHPELVRGRALGIAAAEPSATQIDDARDPERPKAREILGRRIAAPVEAGIDAGESFGARRREGGERILRIGG